MLMALGVLVTGIVLADGVCLPLWLAIAGLGVTLPAALRWKGTTLITLALLMAGATTITLRRNAEKLPLRPSLVELRLDNVTTQRDSLCHFNAHIVGYAEGDKVRRCNAAVRVTAPTSEHLTAGDRVAARTHIRAFNPTSDYGDYMLRRGIVGSIRLHPKDIISHQEGSTLGERLQATALCRIEALHLSPQVHSIATSISIGQQSLISKSQRTAYIRSGGAHLLAVSGLHVGFVFVVINLLLLPIAGIRNGSIWRSLLACTMIWAYASMANFSPSVMRAATMLSLFQLSLIVGSGGRSLNTLCFTAFVLLLWDGRTLYDAGFLLSALAVAAIVEWGVPLIGKILGHRGEAEKLDQMRFRVRHPIRGWMRNALRQAGIWAVSAAVVGFVANIATLPLGSMLFGEVTLWGIILGPLMVALCSVATTILLVWVLLPIPPLAGAVGWCTEMIVGTMNALAEWAATTGEITCSLKISPTSCALIYLAFALLTLALWSRERR